MYPRSNGTEDKLSALPETSESSQGTGKNGGKKVLQRIFESFSSSDPGLNSSFSDSGGSSDGGFHNSFTNLSSAITSSLKSPLASKGAATKNNFDQWDKNCQFNLQAASSTRFTDNDKKSRPRSAWD